MVRKADRDGGALSTWSLMFGRDVLASLLATGLATFAFTVPGHREAAVPAHAFGPTGKLVERVGEEGPDPIRRSLRVYETIALFGTQTAEPVPFSTAASADPSRSRVAAHAPDDASGRRVAAILPPERPRAEPAPPPAAERPVVVADASTVAPATRSIRLLGWAVPGSEYIPSGREAVGRLASLGGNVVSLGGDVGALGGRLASEVGLR